MEGFFLEAILIALLILMNGYLAGTEIAVVTAKITTIQRMAESGRRNAKIFLRLKEEPDRFLATIQIGITAVSVLASAIGGAAAVKVIKPFLQAIPFSRRDFTSMSWKALSVRHTSPASRLMRPERCSGRGFAAKKRFRTRCVL